MLVLTRYRKPDVLTKVVMLLPNGERIVVSLLELDRGRAKLGFDAPEDVEIWRAELLEGRDE